MVPLATEIITSEITGRPSPIKELKEQNIPFHGVKEAVFPFNMFPEVDPILGPEMRATGEVMGLASSFGMAYYKAQQAAGSQLPLSGKVLVSVRERERAELLPIVQTLSELGFELIATEGTGKFLDANGIKHRLVHKLNEGRHNRGSARQRAY